MKPALLAALLAALPQVALAQNSQPQPAAAPAAIAAPQDRPYPGVLKLFVDATDLDRRIFRVRETLPVAGPGPLTLLFPNWIPGGHTPRGEIRNLAGLIITAEGRRVEWVRDPVEVSAFHVDVPAGARSLELEFQFLSPTEGAQGRIVMTQEMLNLQWLSTALYPAGYFARQIQIEPSLRVPKDWSFGTALETASTTDGVVTFKTVSFETLMDSPVFAGRWFKKFDLDPNGRSRVTLNVMADEPSLLEVTARQLDLHRALVVQADRLYGARHYDHYDFLLSLSDRMGGIGLEHQRSSENGTASKYFTDWNSLPGTRDLLPHEYTHSWNGKYRRPADLWTPNYNVPMQGSLLWVYEGQTQYWGEVLAARAGLITKQEALDSLASTAATYDNRAGRAWRALSDTTRDPVIANRRALPWVSWQRSEDYYSEAELMWLDVDTLIRERSAGKRSLDDFARAFFGVNDGDWGQLTYNFDDVVKTLNAVEPYDWAGFLKLRLDGHGPGAPLDGLARGGYRLIYTDAPTDFFKSEEAQRKITDLTLSIGLALSKEGDIRRVQWDSPAFQVGLAEGMKIVAVNGIAFDPDQIKDAITLAKANKSPVELIVKAGDRYRVMPVSYFGGLRYPRLQRIGGAPDRLGDILAPRK